MIDPEERNLNVFDLPIEDMSAEYLALATDEFTVALLLAIVGRAATAELLEQQEARVTAIKICNQFILMMKERAERQINRQETISMLNSLI
jgi:hypothetical protein